MLRLPTLAVFAALTSALLGPASYAEEKSIVVASTTSTQDSGLFSHILPLFKTKTGIDVKVLAQGTGQALDTGRRGDADVVFVHAKAAEKKGTPFISRGDRSGTHIAELNLWQAADIDVEMDRHPWYKPIGQGRGATLKTAAASNAYVLSDRGTWLSFKNRGDLTIS